MRRVAALCLPLALGCVLGVVACAPRVQPPGPVVRAPALETDRIVAHDNISLPLRAWLPDQPPTAVFVALHGFNDYSNAFTAPAAYWRDNGIATYAYDQRGFGGTVYRGQWAGADVMARDLTDAVALVRARHPAVPVYLLGVSMGGAVAMHAATGDTPPDVDGMVLVAPAVWGRSTMPLHYRVALWLGAHSLPWATVTGRGLGIKPSDNIEMLRALSADPMVIKETRVDAIDGLVDLMDEALAAADRVDLPVLVLYGENDQIVPKAPTRAMLERLPAANSTIAIYDGGYHMLLRDLQAEIVHRDVAAWVADPAAPLPSGADGNAGALFAAEE
ncbi:MAG: alpha/beta hydrolase [Alphaproteobacteria bacterium]|nr:alpha/beta hydrolase [Alphaproteobacteria bacterium]